MVKILKTLRYPKSTFGKAEVMREGRRFKLGLIADGGTLFRNRKPGKKLRVGWRYKPSGQKHLLQLVEKAERL